MPLGVNCYKCEFGNYTFRECQKVPAHDECERYSELWNLVFPQYDMQPDGTLEDLEKPGVDTGAGLERFAAVLQGVASNYETDLFTPIIEKAQEIVGHTTNEPELVASFRVVADHARAMAFAIADGVTFSNEGRGYVLRRILRRALRHGRQKLGYPEPFLHLLIPTVIQSMGSSYPELIERSEFIENLVKSEEETFSATLDRGLVLFEAVLETSKKDGGKVISGDNAFNLYDTYGFPLDMTVVMAEEAGMTVDREGFKKRMGLHRERSRAISRFEVEQSDIAGANLPPTEFVGYSTTRTEAKVLYFDDRNIVLDTTPFYAEAGGQAGDTGFINGGNFEFAVRDTRKAEDVTVHSGGFETDGRPKIGEPATAQVDEERRNAIMRNHTATHLLQWALREVLGKHIKQTGSHVTDEGFRFDFTHHEALTDYQLDLIEKKVNEQIVKDTPVNFCEMGYSEALEGGAIAIFEEKYGDKVRMVEVGDYSKELCGGTHVERTGQIGVFHILKEGSIKAGVRRIEALTGEAATGYLNTQMGDLNEILSLLKASDAEEAKEKVRRLLEKERELEKQKKAVAQKTASKTADALAANLKQFGGLGYLYSTYEGKGRKELSAMIDSFKAMDKPVVACLVSNQKKALHVIVGASKTAVSEFNFDSGAFAKDAGKMLGGSGGGRPDFGQAGGKDASALVELEQAFIDTVKRSSGT
jgi:alanyl-tRNA synthetase